MPCGARIDAAPLSSWCVQPEDRRRGIGQASLATAFECGWQPDGFFAAVRQNPSLFFRERRFLHPTQISAPGFRAMLRPIRESNVPAVVRPWTEGRFRPDRGRRDNESRPTSVRKAILGRWESLQQIWPLPEDRAAAREDSAWGIALRVLPLESRRRKFWLYG